MPAALVVGQPGAPTKKQHKYIKFAGGLSGDISKYVAGSLFKTVGDIEVAYVFGVHISFGDNETLAKSVDTAVQVTSQHLLEAIATDIAIGNTNAKQEVLLLDGNTKATQLEAEIEAIIMD